jgi:tetratricopeptide (TPR) repeat protein
VLRSLVGRVQPLSADDLRGLAVEDIENKNYEDAIKKLTLALKCPIDENERCQILGERGDAYAKKGDSEKAERDLTEALKYNPIGIQRGNIFLSRGMLCSQLTSYNSAIGHFSEALTCYPLDQEMQASILFKRAESYLFLNRWDDALKDYTAANDCEFEKRKLRAQILAYRGEIYLLKESLEEAFKDFTEALSFCEPEDRELIRLTRSQIGFIHASRNEHLKAIENYDAALACTPYEPEVLAFMKFRRGASLAELECYDDAIEEFNEAYGCDPQDSFLRFCILYRRGMTYSNKEEFAKALPDLTAAILCAKEEDKAEILHMRAWVNVKLYQYEDAIADFTAVLVMDLIDERKAQLLFHRGQAHLKNNNRTKAEADWNAALGCNFTNDPLRQSILAELRQETAQPAGRISAAWSWLGSKLPAWPRR